jgi:beta-alanine degradation protein BauB
LSDHGLHGVGRDEGRQPSARPRAALGLAGCLLVTCSFAGTPVAVEQEPLHRTVLHNAQVRVFDVQVPPGAQTQWHVHSRDGLSIRLSDFQVEDQPANGAARMLQLHRGDISYGANPAPVTHRVRNVGPGPMRNLYIELQQPAGAAQSDPATVAAAGAAQRPAAFENERVRVLRRTLQPGESSGMHTHPANAVAVAMTAGELTLRGPDGGSRTVALGEGVVDWVAAGVTHDLVNTGATPVELVDVELK